MSRSAPRVPIAALLVLFSLFPAHGWAARPDAPPRGAQAQIEAGIAALRAGDLAAAESALVAGYRTDPRPEALFYLGQVALAQGRKVQAQDFMRRYLSDPDRDEPSSARPDPRPEQGPDPRTDLRAEAQRIVEGPPEVSESGEVSVIGPRGAVVLSGDHFVALLPLLTPLLLAPGTSELTVQQGTRKLNGRIDVQAGRSIEVRYNLDSHAVLVSLPPTLILIEEAGQGADAVPRELRSAIELEIRRAHYAPLSQKAALLRAPGAGACLKEPSCLGELVTKNEAEGLLRMRVQAPRPGAAPQWLVELDLVDGTILDSAASERIQCAGCAPGELGARAGAAVGPLIERARARPRGTLRITSQPAEAEVWRGQQRVGLTPYQQPVFAGDHSIEIRRAGYLGERFSVSVSDGAVATREVSLRPVIAAAPIARPDPPLHTKRPPRRALLAAGIVMLGAAGVLGGFGISALTLVGRCSADTPPTAIYCRDFYDARPAGGVLLGIGAGLAVGGGALIVISLRR